ncbi:MAG: hypothetical protein WKF45_04815 [Ilumatobacteraceae bacterium]
MVDARPALRLIDLAVFAPIGALSIVRRRIESQLTVARAVGEMAVQVGVQQVRARLAADAPPDAGATIYRPDEPAESAVSDVLRPGTPSASDTDSDPLPDVPPPSDLPIPGYESLAASQVVSMLGALDRSNLEIVEQFELANRRRRTVLGKIEQLKRG